jgi:NAD(P)-dependent dehydrogenase (short-subunit alcohol dehydrogenase family)
MRRVGGRLAGKTAIVTGGASGIGGAIAAAFADEAATVGIFDRLPLRELRAGVTSVAVDVTNEADVSRAIASFSESASGLDILVHCAAVQLVGRDSTILNVGTDTWLKTLEVNLTGTFLVCRAAVDAMLATGRGGSIIICGSPTGLRGMSPDFTAYSSSKGGVHALTRVIAAAYGRVGIRANTLIPGATQTPLTAKLFEDQGLRDRLTGRTPLGRLGLPEDYVGAAIFLASDESAFATGAEFVIDGGYGAS